MRASNSQLHTQWPMTSRACCETLLGGSTSLDNGRKSQPELRAAAICGLAHLNRLPLTTSTSVSNMLSRLALLLWHMLLVVTLEDPLSEASSAHDHLDVVSPESWIPEPLPEVTVRVCPLPFCKGCPTAEQIQAPGIRFALEMGYGAASIRHHNGTYQNLAYIAGESNYISLLQHLESGSPRSPAHDLATYRGKVLWATERIQRLLSKNLGRPATPTIAVLADMLSKLKKQVQSVLKDGRKVTAAVLSSPDLVSLSGEEITDALKYLSITNLMAKPDTLEDLYASSAAYAGLGMGLCEHCTDPYVCEQEDNQIYPSKRLLHLDFSPESLCVTIRWIKSAKESKVDKSIVDHDLGLGRSYVLKDVYCYAVRSRIR